MRNWNGSFLIGDWLRSLHMTAGVRPPMEVGVYVVSVDKWSGAPTCACRPLYVGGQTSSNSSLRRRMGDWICDSFGFFMDDARGNVLDGCHAGAQTLFKWCREHQTSLLDLHVGWSVDGCFRCLENTVYDDLKPSGTLINKIRPGRCGVMH